MVRFSTSLRGTNTGKNNKTYHFRLTERRTERVKQYIHKMQIIRHLPIKTGWLQIVNYIHNNQKRYSSTGINCCAVALVWNSYANAAINCSTHHQYCQMFKWTIKKWNWCHSSTVVGVVHHHCTSCWLCVPNSHARARLSRWLLHFLPVGTLLQLGTNEWSWFSSLCSVSKSGSCLRFNSMPSSSVPPLVSTWEVILNDL